MEPKNIISCFLVKVASRCNLDCDYCYMYHHADQGWRKMPAFLSTEHEDLLAFRIAEYAQKVQLTRLLIVYHGGEPLLVGINALERITTKIKNSLPAAIAVDFSIQTNGTLLTEELLDKLETLNISVSLSLDGPEVIHDKHRVDHAGKPSFKKVQTALEMLLKRKQIFSGLIAVIDPVLSPDKLLEYFDAYAIPNLDILLPDANYVRLPPGKENNPNLYIDWLLKCFDLWFDKFPHIRIRFFDSILDSIVGLPSKTDALGFGNVSLLTIETDGSYHDLDVLKIAYDGASNLHLGGLSTTSVENAVQSSQIQKHSYLLTKEGLSDICQECSVVDTCAGGAVPHRYSLEGFVNPTIYCDELFALINHAKKRLTEQLENEIDNSKADSLLNFSKEDLLHFEDTSLSFSLLEHMLSSWGELQKEKFKEALLHSQDSNSGVTNSVQLLLELSEDQFKYLSLQPSVYTWTNVTNAAKKGESVTNIDGKSILIDYSYVERIPDFLKNNFSTQRINRNDNWLRAPFGEKIQYENTDSTLKATIILEDAYQLINQWDSNLLKEIKLISPEVQFIKDITAHPEKIVSFSDNSVPGALYVTVKIGDKYIDAADLADSILHEYRHQKLYLLQRISDVISIDVPLVRSPWREELRPPSGLFHALYVFSFLRNFWQHLAVTTNIIFKKRAEKEVSVITDRIMEGIDTVRNTRLTETGICLLNILELNSTKVLQ